MARSPVFSWLGYTGIDVVGRFAILIVVTAVLARIFPPESFGVAALTMSVASLLATVSGGVPFEEPLVQRKHVRTPHVDTAFAVSFALSAVFVCLSALLGDALGRLIGFEDLRWPLVAAMLILFGNTLWNVSVAVARRRRRFNEIATCNLVGHGIGAVAALSAAWAFSGASMTSEDQARFGVFLLIGFRLVAILAAAGLLAFRLRLRPGLDWSRGAFDDLRRFAGFSLAERFLENAVYLLFNLAVGVALGAAALGQLNMAMRIIEPLRGALIAMSHNLAYPFIRASVERPDEMRDRTMTLTRTLTLIAAPAFLGLAAISSTLLPVIAGPGWEPAADIAALLAIGGSFVAIGQAMFTAMQASARPDINLARRICSILAMAAAFIAAAPAGALAAGVARMTGDVVEAAFSQSVGLLKLGLSAQQIVANAAKPWGLAALMGLLVHAAASPLAAHVSGVFALPLLMALGVVTYGALLAALAPADLALVRSWINSAAREAAN